DDLDRASGLEREQRRMPGDHRRIFFLAAETAPGLRLDDPDVHIGTQQTLEGFHDVERALDRAEHRDATVFPEGDDTIRRELDVLLMTRAIGAVDDEVRPGESARHISFVDRD